MKSLAEKLREFLPTIYKQYGPLNARQYAYRCETAGLVTKKQFGYVNAVLVKLRKSGVLPWNAVLDSSRRFEPWRVVGSEDINEELEYAKKEFKGLPEKFNLPKWHYQPVVPVIFSEKEGLIPYFEMVADDRAVSVYAEKGFAGLSHLHDVVVPWILRLIDVCGKKVRMLYLGDCDDEGYQIPMSLVETIVEWTDGSPKFNVRDFYPRYPKDEVHCDGSMLEFERVALKPEQVKEWNLSTLPINPKSKIARKFVDFKCELEAMDPAVLRELIVKKIDECWDAEAEKRRQVKTAELREALKKKVEELTKGWQTP